MLQGGYVLYPTRAARVLVKGAAARCRVQLLEWSALELAGGAAAGCCFKVLQLKWCVCALELACWCHCRSCRVLLSDFSQKQQEA